MNNLSLVYVNPIGKDTNEIYEYEFYLSKCYFYEHKYENAVRYALWTIKQSRRNEDEELLDYLKDCFLAWEGREDLADYYVDKVREGDFDFFENTNMM